MIEMNPYYAKSSTVGPVFDVATFSSRKAFAGGVTFLIFGILFTAVDVYLWNPEIVGKRPPAAIKDLQKEIRQLDKEHPIGMQVARGVIGFIGLFGILGGLAFFHDSAGRDYYLRAGMGGLSMRVPDGISLGALGMKSRVLLRDLRWDEIEKWEIVQTKRLGSISANAGNLYADLNLATVYGEHHSISLDHFREPARIIWNRLQDAMETTPASLDPGATNNDAPAARTPDDKRELVATSLAKMLWQKDGAVIFSDAQTGKFVQFAIPRGSLFLDLPEQTLDEAQFARASEIFERLGQTVQEYELLDRPGGVAVDVQRSFQLDLGEDVEAAVEITLAIFSEVYRLDPDFELTVERV